MKKESFYVICIGTLFGSSIAEISNHWIWKDNWHDVGTAISAICISFLALLIIGWWCLRKEGA